MSRSKLGGRKVDFVIKPNIRKCMKKHSHHNVRLDDYTKRVLVAASEKTSIKQAEIVRELILAKFPEIAKRELFK